MSLGFLAGGGEMGERMRAFPWARTPLGEPHAWPQSLRTAVRILLATGHPTEIFWGPDLTVLYNDAFSRSLGPEKHPSILGKPAREAWPEVWPLVGEQFGQVMRGDGAVWQENVRIPIVRHGELQEVFWTYSFSPIDEPSAPRGVGGILVQAADVTARTLTDRALAFSRARLDYATRLVGVGFWYCDLPFDFLEWDERVKEHFFFPPEARVTIDDFYARIHPEDRQPTRTAIETSIRDHSVYDIVYRTVHPGTGQTKWIRALGGTDYAADGTPRHFDGVTLDVTEQELQDKRKDEFIATLSHELRNPLAPIRAAAKVIASPQAAPAQVRQAQSIVERQVNHMALLLDDLLDIARITQGKLQLKLETLSLIDVVDAAVEAVRPSLDAKNQQLEVSLPHDPATLVGDHLRLSQVISNLLMNAVKYSDPGKPIQLECRVQGEELALSVKDRGIGIAAESMRNIFEMFSQVEGASRRSEGGLGIGLALVKGIVTLHGGRVEARSAGLGAGSEFIVHLPLASQPRVETRPAAEHEIPAPARRRILIADDNRDAAESLAILLEMSGHEVRVANNGRSALSLAQSFRPDTSLLDIGMPDMNGYEVAQALRGEPWARGIQLIALTGWGQESDKRRAFEAGFDHHLIKPVDPDQLAGLIGGART